MIDSMNSSIKGQFVYPVSLFFHKSSKHLMTINSKGLYCFFFVTHQFYQFYFSHLYTSTVIMFGELCQSIDTTNISLI